MNKVKISINLYNEDLPGISRLGCILITIFFKLFIHILNIDLSIKIGITTYHEFHTFDYDLFCN